MTPSQKLNLPVIGIIRAKLEGVVNGKPFSSEDEFEVIKVLEQGDKKVYVCNQWYKDDVPQIVHEDFVVSFEEK